MELRNIITTETARQKATGLLSRAKPFITIEVDIITAETLRRKDVLRKGAVISLVEGDYRLVSFREYYQCVTGYRCELRLEATVIDNQTNSELTVMHG